MENGWKREKNVRRKEEIHNSIHIIRPSKHRRTSWWFVDFLPPIRHTCVAHMFPYIHKYVKFKHFSPIRTITIVISSVLSVQIYQYCTFLLFFFAFRCWRNTYSYQILTLLLKGAPKTTTHFSVAWMIMLLQYSCRYKRKLLCVCVSVNL